MPGQRPQKQHTSSKALKGLGAKMAESSSCIKACQYHSKARGRVARFSCDAHGLNEGNGLGCLQERDVSDLRRQETKNKRDGKKVLRRNQYGNTSTHALPQVNEEQQPVGTPWNSLWFSLLCHDSSLPSPRLPLPLAGQTTATGIAHETLG